VRPPEERLSTRAVERVFGPCYQTLRRWVEKKAATLPRLHETLLPAEKGRRARSWMNSGASLAARKRASAGSGSLLCRRTRQIVASMLGDRSVESARWLRRSLPPDYACQAARSDLWLSLRACHFRHAPISFVPSKEAGETCHVERFFWHLAQCASARLVRRSLSFSKSFAMHELWLRIFLTNCNLSLQP
jgi:insertion element IS1 protein InsB